jgi:hypothetical protein
MTCNICNEEVIETLPLMVEESIRDLESGELMELACELELCESCFFNMVPC